MAASVPKIKLSNGEQVPVVGLGTWLSEPGVVKEVVKTAIEVGYRHLDCAHIYGNEGEIGEAIAEKIADGTIKREDIFITSKVWNTFHSKGKVAENLAITLKNLRLSYLDLYLIHWPHGYKEGGDLVPKDESGETVYSNVDYVETWKGMEEAAEKGLVKSIGLSNFNSEQIDRVIGVAKINPVMLQVECHPYLNQQRLIKFCKERGITVTAYSPLGAPANPWAKEGDPWPLKDDTVVKIGQKHNKSPAQVLIKYQVQREIVVIPKTVTKERLQQNANIFDFTLDATDMGLLNKLDRNGRVCGLSWDKAHRQYPFSIPF